MGRNRGRWAASLAAAAILTIAMLAPATTSLARLTDAADVSGTWASDTLAAPTGLAATGGSAVTLTWTPTVDGYATGYTVLRGPTSGGPYSAIGSVTPRTATTTTDSPGNGTWSYVLRSVFESWTSAVSNEASATVSTNTSTAYATCVAASNAADTPDAGDDNGYESNPSRACVDDALSAMDDNSGTGGNQSCGTGTTPDVRKDRHRFWGFATGVPGSVTSIDGISVRADLGMNNNGGNSNVCVQLSWDGGATWTAMQAQAINTMTLTTYTFGSATDTWGRTWTPGQLSAANFRVRLIDASSQGTKQFRLDYLAVSVTYTP